MNRILITRCTTGGYLATELRGMSVFAVNRARTLQMLADMLQAEWPVGTEFRWCVVSESFKQQQRSAR